MTAPRSADAATEAELVELFRRTGDRRWFARLYERTRRRVFAVCLRRVRDSGRAEEICHEAFVKAFRGFDRFEGTTFCSWVCRIAVNLSLNDLRHRAVVERASQELELGPPPDRPDERAVTRERLAAALSILDGLAEHQRRVFLLRHLDGLSYDEIARRTGFDPAQVRSYLQNARRNFQIAWERRSDREVADG